MKNFSLGQIDISSRLKNHLRVYFSKRDIEYNKSYRIGSKPFLIKLTDILLVNPKEIQTHRNFGKKCMDELLDLQNIALKYQNNFKNKRKISRDEKLKTNKLTFIIKGETDDYYLADLMYNNEHIIGRMSIDKYMLENPEYIKDFKIIK